MRGGCCGSGWTDDLRRQLFEEHTDTADFNAQRYSSDNRRLVYEAMFRNAGEQLAQRLSIVLDGTFLTRDSRQRALQLASDYHAVPLLITCTCPPDVASARIRDRGPESASNSEFRPEYVERQRAEEEPADPDWPSCSVDTSEGYSTVRQAIFNRIRPLVLPGCATTHTPGC